MPDAAERAPIADRSMVVRRLKALPVEAVVRGYLIGSGWKDYQRTGAVCGIPLPPGLRMADQLPQPIFTPSTKADRRASTTRTWASPRSKRRSAPTLAAQVRDTAIALYEFAAAHALARGIIIADTKFEFGVDEARHADADRRGADPGFVALLAGGHLRAGHEPALLRQAVRARLPRDARLEQDAARPAAAGRR